MGLLYKDSVTIKKIEVREKESFEFAEWNITNGSFRARLVVLYRPPYSEDHPVTIATFLAEFSAFMETIILVPEPLIIVGDFNIHVDCSDGCNDASNFLDLLQSFGLTQHVTGPTHEDGHTLDLIITRSFDKVVSTNPVIDTYVSDHASVLCNRDCGKPTEFQEKVSFRKLMSIDMDVFREKVSRSELCTKSFTDLEELVGCYNTTLTNLLDQYAPVKTRTIIKRKCVPWFNGDIRLAIRVRRTAVRKWRKSRSEQDLRAFKAARNHATYIMTTARKEYWTDVIHQNDGNQLFQSVKPLLCKPCKVSSPPDVNPSTLANEFGRFFQQKINSIHESLEVLSVPLPSLTSDDETYIAHA